MGIGTIFLLALDDGILLLGGRPLGDVYLSALVVALLPAGGHLAVIADVESAVYLFIEFLNELVVLGQHQVVAQIDLSAHCEIGRLSRIGL